MTKAIKAYKSPLGFYFTAEEEARYLQAIEGAIKFFETYGKGMRPRNAFGIVENEFRYKFNYYEKPVGSLQVMEKKAEKVIEEAEGEWMSLDQLAEHLNIHKNTLRKLIIPCDLPSKKGTSLGSRPVNLYRLSDAVEIITQWQNKYTKDGKIPMLTEEELQSGQWMRLPVISEVLGIRTFYNRLCTLLNTYDAPCKFRLVKSVPRKYYNIDQIRELEYVKDLLKRLGR